jgi:hypothetical protein
MMFAKRDKVPSEELHDLAVRVQGAIAKRR